MRQTMISLESDAEIKLRGAIEDIQEAAESLTVMGKEIKDAGCEECDRGRNVGENIINALGEIRGLLGY